MSPSVFVLSRISGGHQVLTSAPVGDTSLDVSLFGEIPSSVSRRRHRRREAREGMISRGIITGKFTYTEIRNPESRGCAAQN